jgi:hypothetical protein
MLTNGYSLSSKRGEAVDQKFLAGRSPFKGSRRKETDRVAAAKDSLPTFFSQRK